MKKLIKKAFTLVELLVVLAILAALATVGILSYSAYTKKANNASDNTLLAQLNHQLSLMEENPKTYSEMREYLDENAGMEIDRISTFTKNCKYAWNIDENKLYLVEDGKRIIAPAGDEKELNDTKERHRYYVPINSDTEVETNGKYEHFSCYLKENATSNDELVVNANVECGNNTKITKIKYVNTDSNDVQKSVICTNSYETSISINAPYDTIEHYGKIGSVLIQSVADHSYIEYGNGAIIQVNDGHIVIKSDSDIAKIHFSKIAKENESDSDKFEDILVTLEDGAKLPEMSRDSVDIKEGEEIKVCTVETTAKMEDVILTKQGIAEQIILKETEKATTRYAEYVENPLEEEDKQNATAVMLANNLNGFNRDDDGKINSCVVTSKDDTQEVTSEVEISFDYTTREFTFNQTKGETLDSSELKNQLEERVQDSGRDAAEVIEETVAQFFADIWDGTIDITWYDDTKDEFVITTAEQLAGLAKLVNDGNTFENKIIKLGRDINLNENPDFEEFEGMINWTAIGYAYGSYLPLKPFSGTFDGQGHSVINMFRRCYNTEEYSKDTYGAIYPYGLFGCIKNATIKNLIVDNAYFAGEEDVWYTNAMGGFVGVAFGDCTFDSLKLQNSYLCGYISNCGGIVGGCTSGNMTFNNISVDNTNILTTWDWGKWSSCDVQMGGIIGQIDIQDNYPDKDHTNSNGLYTTHVALNDCTVACQLMQMNDVMSNYAWYEYRSSGMLIGGFTHNKSDGLWNNCDNVNDTMLTNALTCSNVKVVYDLWNHQYYCRNEVSDPTKTYSGDHAGRFDKTNNFSNELVGTHKEGCCGDHDCLVFDQLIGGWSGGTWRYETGNSFEAYKGVVVTYLNNSNPTK